MNSRTAQRSLRRCLSVGVFVALVVVAGIGAAAPQAWARATYIHGGIDPYGCGECHLNNHTWVTPVNEVCNTCHPGFALPSASTMCWTCHTPGQDMSGARSDAACTAACHLPDGTTSTHVAHPDRPTTCSTCHPVSASVTEAAGSPHHTRPLPPTPVVTGFLPSPVAVGDLLTLTGTGFTGTFAVGFNGTPAKTFHVIASTQITAIVPFAATSGPVTVTTVGGTGTSATSVTIVTVVNARVTLRLSTTSATLGKTIRATGVLSPASPAGTAVRLKVRAWKSGEWTTVKTAFVSTTAGGAYGWAYRPSKRGSYRVQSAIATTASHTAALSRAVAFTVR